MGIYTTINVSDMSSCIIEFIFFFQIIFLSFLINQFDSKVTYCVSKKYRRSMLVTISVEYLLKISNIYFLSLCLPNARTCFSDCK